MQNLTKLASWFRAFLIFVPNFPAILTGRDTQPFYLVAVYKYYDFTPKRILLFVFLALLSLLEGMPRVNRDGFIFNHLEWMILIFLLSFLHLKHNLVLNLYNNLNTILSTIVFVTICAMYVPDILDIFSRQVTSFDFSRSGAFVFPEPSYAAKTFFGFFVLFAISLNRISKTLIVFQFVTFSATGIGLGFLSLLIALSYTRNKLYAYPFYIIFTFFLLSLSELVSVDYSSYIPQRGLLILELILRLDFLSLQEFFMDDASLQSRLDWIQSGELNSLYGFVKEYPLCSTILIMAYVARLLNENLNFKIFFMQLITVIVFGYADSFLYPAFIFCLCAVPRNNKNVASI